MRANVDRVRETAESLPYVREDDIPEVDDD
jgi:hypothetical protein